MKNRLLQSARDYLDLIRSLVVVRSPAGRVEYANERICFLLGYEKKDIMDKDWFENFTAGGTKTSSRRAFQKDLAAGKGTNQRREEYLRSRSGELFLVEWQDNYLKDGAGNIIGVLSSGEDITEKQLLRETLLRQRMESRKELMQAVLEAAERERREIAYELHDGINQVLTVCKLMVEEQMISAPDQKGGLSQVARHLQKVITGVREIAHRLNPAGLGNESLYEAAKALIANINRANKISIKEKIIGIKYLKALEPGMALNLFRILQEALTNIIRHAEAGQVKILLAGSPTAVELEIRDDGRGFCRQSVKAGLGLKNMYTRAEAMGGKAYISSSPGDGTLLSIHIPLG